MARFPLKEAEILALANDMATGLGANAVVYPAPPVAPVDLQTRMGSYITARDASVAATAAAEQATAAKNEALQALTDDMKADLRYAETTVNYDDDQLKLIGWCGRKSKTSLEAPGQVRSLEAPREGEGWVFLDWKEPVDGGAVAAYKIQRRLRPDGAWSEAEWPSKAKSRSPIKSAARNGNTASSPSTKRERADPATPSWGCCEILRKGGLLNRISACHAIRV